MSLELCVLASGSTGNCSVLRAPAGVMLIDAGIGPITTSRRLSQAGVGLAAVRAMCLTHLDSDHFNTNWAATILKRGIRVYCHWRQVDHVRKTLARHPAWEKSPGIVEGFDDRSFSPLTGVSFDAIELAHDTTGSHGFVIEGHGRRIGYATDLGRVPAELIEHFASLDLLAIESNYDPDMQRHSGRPANLQRRITGGAGHLSNQQAYDAVKLMLNRAESRAERLPRHIVLLHRSRQCNCPKLVRRLFSQDVRIGARLVLAEAFEATGWLRTDAVGALPGEQLTLAWSS